MAQGPAAAENPMRLAQRVLLAQLDNTIEELGKRSRSDAAVHDIRKELKRARAALRMLRECTGAAEYRRNNALIRDAARPLTPIRDAKVLLQTLERARSKKSGHSTEFLSRFAGILQEERRRSRRQLRAAALAAAARMLRGVRRRVAALPDGRLQPAHPRALKRAFKKARSAFTAAQRHGTDEELHEWRKQTKYFANQLEMALSFCSKSFEKSHRHATQLAECLGDDHDLALLTEQISKHGAAAPGAAALVRGMRRSRKKLQRRALRLGRRLYSRKAARYQL